MKIMPSKEEIADHDRELESVHSDADLFEENESLADIAVEAYRDALIRTCYGIDRHGVFSDEDSILEMGYVLTIDELEDTLVNLWQDETGLSKQEVISTALSYYNGEGSI